jgi:RNA recognition motif-containing protein
MDSNHQLTILNLLSKEYLVNVVSTLLNENSTLKSRVQDLESQVSQIVQVFQELQNVQQQQLLVSPPAVQSQELPLEEDDVQKRKLFVRNISFAANKYDLYNVFSKYGRVEHAKILYEKNSFGVEQSKGYGFVIFENIEDAQKAVDQQYFNINGRIAQCYLASKGNTRPPNKQ